MTGIERFGPKPKDSLGCVIWASQIQGWNHGVDYERDRWREIIALMAEKHRGAVQAALWSLAEMMEKNITHVSVRTNTK